MDKIDNLELVDTTDVYFKETENGDEKEVWVLQSGNNIWQRKFGVSYTFFDEDNTSVYSIPIEYLIAGSTINLSSVIVPYGFNDAKFTVNGQAISGATILVDKDLEIRVDVVRKTYMISLDLNGGSGIGKLTGKYESQADLPIPTRQPDNEYIYEFLHWIDGVGNIYSGSIKFTENLFLTAVWTTAQRYYWETLISSSRTINVNRSTLTNSETGMLTINGAKSGAETIASFSGRINTFGSDAEDFNTTSVYHTISQRDSVNSSNGVYRGSGTSDYGNFGFTFQVNNNSVSFSCYSGGKWAVGTDGVNYSWRNEGGNITITSLKQKRDRAT